MADDPQLVTTEEVGGWPGGNDIPATPGTEVTIRVDPTQQYTAGSRLQWYQSIPRALPWALDDVSTDFGDDIYERMLLDSQVRAQVNVLKSGILDTGVHLTSAIDDKTDPEYDAAAALVTEIEAMLDDLSPDLDAILWDMLDAIALGNRMAEQVYGLGARTDGGTEYRLVRLAVKPRESVAFVVDAYMTVLGILGRIPGQPFGVQQGMLLTSLDTTPNVLPRSKFAVLTIRPHDSDPRGTSVLRPAFDAWNAKTQLKREYLKYLSQFATPSLIGYTAENAQPYYLTNPDGSYQLDGNGNPLVQTPEAAMLAALQAFANGTATAFPFGAKVQPLQTSGNGEAFQNAFGWYDQQITKAILHQTLATEEGEHQSRAASGTHKDILDTVIRQCKRPVERMIERDILHTYLALNGMQDRLHLCPTVSLGTISQEDIPQRWAAVAALHKANYLHKSQYAEIDSMIGLPERTPPDATTVAAAEAITVEATSPLTDMPDDDAADDDAPVIPPTAPTPTTPTAPHAGFAAADPQGEIDDGTASLQDALDQWLGAAIGLPHRHE